MEKLAVHQLKLKANDIRQDIIEMLVAAGSGHSAGPLGMADVFAALYFHVMDHRPEDPTWAGRDRLVLSCGHICPVLYATLAEAGYFPKEELATLRKLNSRLQGHPHNIGCPGIENSSGPLGQGTSQAVGMALAARMNHEQHRIYCIASDGEHNEGQVWEALMFAGKNKLHNLTLILDRNNIQIDGYTEDVMPLEPLRQKYEAFGWHVIDIDGNNAQMVVDACMEAAAIYEKPTVIIAHTIPGMGVGYMQNRYEWHSGPPGTQDVPGAPSRKEQEAVALRDLRTLHGKIESEQD